MLSKIIILFFGSSGCGDLWRAVSSLYAFSSLRVVFCTLWIFIR